MKEEGRKEEVVDEDNFSVESACVSLFLVFHRIGESISLDLFYFGTERLIKSNSFFSSVRQ